ncbi:MAG: hydrogenase [Burkholderiaceae bacterium]
MTLHPLVQRLLAQPGAQALAPDTLDAWLARGGEQVLLFGGDPVRFPAALDVAVVLPELRAANAGRFAIGVVPREHEDAMARRFGVQRWPSLVFVRDGGYLGTVSGMRDWADYVREVAEVLARDASRAPTVGIPVVSAAPAADTCR